MDNSIELIRLTDKLATIEDKVTKMMSLINIIGKCVEVNDETRECTLRVRDTSE